MALVEVQPLVMRNVSMLFAQSPGASATHEYKKALDSVSFTPTSSTITWTGLGENTFTAAATSTWTCVLNYAQDWETEDSLSQFLYENAGETIEATFKPRSGSGPSFTANLIITEGAIGGAVNTVAVASVTLGCDKPVLVPAA